MGRFVADCSQPDASPGAIRSAARVGIQCLRAEIEPVPTGAARARSPAN